MAKPPTIEADRPFEEAVASVNRITNLDTKSLVRQSDLGERGAFHGAVEPADRLKILFSRLPAQALREFPENELSQIKTKADSVYNLFQQVLDFDPDQGEPATRRDQLISQIDEQYQPIFKFLMPLVSYAVAREVDWDQLSSDGRAAVQTIRDEASGVFSELGETSSEAKRILQEVREAAAEQGVTQQAKFFATEASQHAEKSDTWKKATFKMSWIVVGYAVLTLFFPTISYFKAETLAEAIQLTTSKVLIFFVLASILLLFIKNFGAHKHNSIVNKHRQNALMTYTTLAEAGGSFEARDVILQHAAAAIYAPIDTGYVKHEERGYQQSFSVPLSARMASSSAQSNAE